MRKYLAKLDCNNMPRNKTAIERLIIPKYEIERIIDQSVPLKKQGNGLERNTCQKKNSIQPNCGWFIGLTKRTKITQITKRHLIKLRLKLDNLKEAMKK